MKKIIPLLLFMTISLLFAERIQEVTIPTAGILQKGEAKVYSKIYNHNGLIAGASIGFFNQFMFGVSYGGEQIVGDQDPIWHDKVDFNAKLRIFDETLKSPALVLGFDSQGLGSYHKSEKRYDIKSKGFYAVVSKNYKLLGDFGIDGGVNYSLEDKDDPNNLNAFIGSYKSIGPIITVMADYDFAFNDNDVNPLNAENGGYLNAAVELKINEQFSIKALAIDLLENRPNAESFDRSVLINYRWKY